MTFLLVRDVKTSGTRSMDEREAFWAAVCKFTSPECSPAFADQPTFDVKGKYLTIRQVCELVKDITEELPYLVAGEVVKTMHGDHRLISIVRLISNIRDRISMFVRANG